MHQKNHRWESFTAKIEKLNSLDPLRRVRPHSLDEEDTKFKKGLERWGELNYSDGFTSFSHEVAPLCDSLPQILHFQDKIMDLLATYIEKREKSSLEPLLVLLADFAYDLNVRFEKYYSRALGLVTSLVGTGVQDVEMIEWSFTCLVFMFKFLWKLLAPDLRPTYDLMAPLLGKKRQQPHIVRFASEAMSFLIKKAASAGEQPLRSIVDHARKDLLSLVGNQQFGLYYHGLMTLFAEACKASMQTISKLGERIFSCLYSTMDEEEFDGDSDGAWSNVVCGVLTSLIHHATPETLAGGNIIAVVLEKSALAVTDYESNPTSKTGHQLLLSAKAIGILAGVRNGSRVLDWPSLVKELSQILKTMSKSPKAFPVVPDTENQLWKSAGLSTAIVFLYAPEEALIPFVAVMLDALTKDPLACNFLTFCSYFAQIGGEGKEDRKRFGFVLPYFQK